MPGTHAQVLQHQRAQTRGPSSGRDGGDDSEAELLRAVVRGLQQDNRQLQHEVTHLRTMLMAVSGPGLVGGTRFMSRACPEGLREAAWQMAVSAEGPR